LSPTSPNPQCRAATKPLSSPPATAKDWNSEKKKTHRATTNDLVFREYRIQLHRVGNGQRSIYLARTPPAHANGRPSAFADSAQLPLRRLAILIPSVVSPDLPSAFAHPKAYGDMIAAILALFSLLLLPSTAGLATA